MLKPSLLLFGLGSLLFAAASSSANYSLQNYGINSGSTNNSSSASYNLNASSGEVSGGASTGASDTTNSGSIAAKQANVPLAPTLSNGSGSYYNKLGFIINTSGSDASDYTYSIAVSTDNFNTVINYVQADGTLASGQVFQTYSVWGGSGGSYITGLAPNTSYQVKVSARQGTFSQSAFGAAATASTANPSLTFSVSPNSLSLGNLLPATVTTSPTISFSFATNAANGGTVYLAGSNNGLSSTAAGYTIAASSADLSSASSGFGFQGQSASQTSGGALSLVSPYNGSGSVVGAEATTYRSFLSSPNSLAGGSATAVLKAKAASLTPAASDYQEVLTFIAAANF